jgi:hypothetical protein
MPKILIEYTKTEVTRQQVWIEADTPTEALRMVSEYDSDDSEPYQVACLLSKISDVEVVPE